MSSLVDEGLRSSEGRTGPSDERPLTQQEYQLLQRLFSDPFSFPIAFKTWLVSYLESSDLSLPIGAVNGLTSILGISGVGGGTLGIFPAGIIFPYGGATPPTGALLCNGASYATSAQQRLFDAIGYRYGGSGASFNVPDLLGRIPVGIGPHPDVNAPNLSDLLPAASRSPKHNSQKNGSATKSGTVSLTGANSSLTLGGMQAFSSTPGSGSAGAGGGDRALVNVALGGANSSLGISDGIGVGDNITVGPGGTRPTDTPAFLTFNFIIVS